MDPLISRHCVWMRRKGLAQNTISKRRSRLRRVAELGPLGEVDTEQIEQLLDSIVTRNGGPLGVKARYQWISDLSQFYRWGIDFGHLECDPTVRLVRPRQRKGLPRPIGTADLAMGLRMAEPTMRAWLSLMAFGGLRCAEVAALEVDWLRWDDRLIVVTGKRDKVRTVPMHCQVERTLRSVTLPSRGRAFRRPNGDPWPAWAVSREVSCFFSSIGVSATAHMMRHWCGTQLLRVTGDLRVVQEILGHSDPGTTAVYAAWSKQEARRAVDALSVDDVDADLFSDWPSAVRGGGPE